MKKIFRVFLKCILFVVAVICVGSFFAMRADISDTDREINRVISQIKEQKLRNEEYSSILSDENFEDFCRAVAEDDLDYGTYGEKIYINISGK